jgi:hypothetical protein
MRELLVLGCCRSLKVVEALPKTTSVDSSLSHTWYSATSSWVHSILSEILYPSPWLMDQDEETYMKLEKAPHMTKTIYPELVIWPSLQLRPRKSAWFGQGCIISQQNVDQNTECLILNCKHFLFQKSSTITKNVFAIASSPLVRLSLFVCLSNKSLWQHLKG